MLFIPDSVRRGATVSVSGVVGGGSVEQVNLTQSINCIALATVQIAAGNLDLFGRTEKQTSSLDRELYP